MRTAISMHIKGLLLVACIFFGFLLFSPQASAQDDDFGPWYSTASEASQAYSADIQPFNNSEVAEQVSFACVTEDGYVLTEEDRQTLGAIYIAAGQVYEGNFGTKDIGARAPDNGGYDSGVRGMQQFLEQEKTLLEKGLWADYNQRTFEKGDTEDFDYRLPRGSSENSVLIVTGDGLPPQTGQRISSLIDDNVTHPLALTEGLPEACSLFPLDPEELEFGAIFGSPGAFLTDLLLYVPSQLASQTYEFINPYAFRYTFWTPHTERGDTIWNVATSCSPGQDSALVNTDSCQGSTPLGYSQENQEIENQSSWFLTMSQFVQWLVSGTYFLLLFSAATIYMVRGNRASSLSVIRLVPRLLLSILLTIFAPFLIGILITSSNLLVSFVFDVNDTPVIGTMNSILLQAGNITGGGELLQRIVQVIVGGFSAFFFLVFVIFSLIRQVILVGLIILAPVAAFCLIIPRFRERFVLYSRLLIATIFSPLILAFILKLGVMLNPILLDPLTSYGSVQGVLGLILIVATFFLMYKAIKLTYSYARGNLTGDLRDLNPWKESPSPAPALSAPASNAPTNIVPENRRISVAPQASASVKEQAKQKPMTAISAPTGSLVQPQSKPAQRQMKSVFSAFNERRAQKDGDKGQERLSESQAEEYKEELKARIDKMKKLRGRELSPEEIQEIEELYAEERGGKLMEKNGTYYLSKLKKAKNFTKDDSNDRLSKDEQRNQRLIGETSSSDLPLPDLNHEQDASPPIFEAQEEEPQRKRRRRK